MAMERRRAPAAQSRSEISDLLQALVFGRLLSRDQAEVVRKSIQANSTNVIAAIATLGFATEQQVAEAAAQFSGLPFVKIDPLELDLDLVTSGLSIAFARRHGLVAISKSATAVTVAVANPFAPFPADDIRRVTGLDVQRVVAARSEIEAITTSFYGLRTSLQTAEKQLSARRVFDLSNQEFLSGQAEELDPAAAPVVKALDHLLSYAFEQRASDIHFEPKRNATVVRLRIDGMLHDVHILPRIVYQAIVSRIKLLSGCDIAERRRPQDGRIKREQGGREIELRVSTMPTVFGEKAVLRIFDPDILLKDLDQLGFSSADLVVFERFLTRPHGIILVTGPTGSGKTTTLYSVLKRLSQPDVNIVTIEDPIEMVQEDLNQVAVRPAIDLTFASALRTVLRQDPDIIMVGEIRDRETAENAVQAALTGHLVFSTLHTNDAPSSVTRLLDLRIPHFLVVTTLIGVVAQRLVRVNCAHCSQPYEPTAPEMHELGLAPERMATAQLRRGAGCLHCRQTGYAGRDGIFQIMPMSERLRGVIAREGTSLEVLDVARQEGMRTLREAAAEKVLAGVTTISEMLRVTGV